MIDMGPWLDSLSDTSRRRIPALQTDQTDFWFTRNWNSCGSTTVAALEPLWLAPLFSAVDEDESWGKGSVRVFMSCFSKGSMQKWNFLMMDLNEVGHCCLCSSTSRWKKASGSEGFRFKRSIHLSAIVSRTSTKAVNLASSSAGFSLKTWGTLLSFLRSSCSNCSLHQWRRLLISKVSLQVWIRQYHPWLVTPSI